jgi:hypothetical protein
LATVARFCARPALRAAAEEMETEAATEADILALVGVVEREARPARNPQPARKDLLLDQCHREFGFAQANGCEMGPNARVPG